jgi:hypothetical protein
MLQPMISSSGRARGGTFVSNQPRIGHVNRISVVFPNPFSADGVAIDEEISNQGANGYRRHFCHNNRSDGEANGEKECSPRKSLSLSSSSEEKEMCIVNLPVMRL